MRLFCLPHAGSGAAIFYRWRRLFSLEIEVCPILLPGREMRFAEASPTEAEEVVDALMQAAESCFDRPYAIFGHSMGALLGYAWACRIQEAGLRPPACLFLSGREAAHVPPRHRILHLMADQQLIEELELRYGSSEALLADAELRALFLPTLRADLKLVESYRHRSTRLLDCPMLVLAGADDQSLSESGLAAWAELTRGQVTVERLPGDHFYHLKQEQGPALAGKIMARLKA